MSKLSLDRLTSSFGFQAAFNSVLESIEQEFSEKVLYRDNPMGTSNVMKNDIDMGEHDILNVGKVAASDFTINGVDITQSLEEALAEVAAYPAEAKGYRDEAEGFRNDAEGFASSAALSEHNAALSASQAFAWKEDAEIAASTAANDAAANVTALLSGYVTDAEDFADDAEQSALDAEAAVSELDARVDILEIDVLDLQADKLDKDENINLGAAYTIVGNETAIDFGSTENPIPEGVKRITVMFDGVIASGTSDLTVRIGSGTFLTSGYVGQVIRIGSTGSVYQSMSSGFDITETRSATNNFNGTVVLDKKEGNTWVATGCIVVPNNTTNGCVLRGVASLSGELDRIRLTSLGADTFSNGIINISWEF